MLNIEARNVLLYDALVAARGMVGEWSAYASDYFQNKHDLPRDLAILDDAIEYERQFK